MTIVRTAAVYARIISDQERLGLGVQCQLEDCRKLAAFAAKESGRRSARIRRKNDQIAGCLKE